MYSRREFGRLLGMSLPMALPLFRAHPALAADATSTVHGVRLGLITYSFNDMPFIVDSVTMELGRQGCGIELIIHPVMRVVRDADGNLVAYDPANGKPLWHTHLGQVSNAVETYMLDGRQYILAASGDTLYAFALNF